MSVWNIDHVTRVTLTLCTHDTTEIILLYHSQILNDLTFNLTAPHKSNV